MRNLRLDICYDGTRYRGWQRLPGVENTIQGKLETVLERMTGKPVKLIGAGRTDAGVHARLEVELITGRTHQIRAHLAHIGHPILGDDKYGDRMLNRQLGVKRQQLWATRLVFQAEGALAYLNGRSFSVKCPF